MSCCHPDTINRYWVVEKLGNFNQYELVIALTIQLGAVLGNLYYGSAFGDGPGGFGGRA